MYDPFASNSLLPLTAYFGSLSAVSLLGAGLLWGGFRKQGQCNARKGEIHVFRFSPSWRYGGLTLMTTTLILSALPPLMMPPGNGKPAEWMLALIIGAFFGVGVVTGMTLWFGRVRCCHDGIEGLSGWGAPRFLTWPALHEVTISAAMQSYKLIGPSTHLYVPLPIEDRDRLFALIRERAPAAKWHGPIGEDPQTLMEDGHYQSLNRAAPKIAFVSAAFVLASSIAIPPSPRALLLSFAAGLCLAAYAAFRNVFPSHPKLLGHIINFTGIVAFSIIGQIARKHSDIERPDIDGYTAMLTVFHDLAAAMLAASLMVLASRHFSSNR